MDTIFKTEIRLDRLEQNESDDVPTMQRSSDWITNEFLSVTIICLYVPFIICSNALVATAVLKFKRLQIATNYFVLSLSVADVFVALALPVYIIAELSTADLFCNIFSLVANRILMTAGTVSIVTLTIISIDRYIAISYSLEYVRIMTKQKIWTSVILSYIYSIIVTWTPVLAGWYRLGAERTTLCFGNIMDDKSRMLFITAVFLPSCVIVVVCYTKIARVARHHARAIEAVENTFQQTIKRKIFNTDRKYAKTLAIVLSIFVLLWTPYLMLLLIQMASGVQINAWLRHYLMLLAFANSGLNPWVYAYKNSDFRTAFRSLIPIFGCRNRVAPVRRRSSMASQISVLPSSGILDRSNSRIVDSDILYVLRQQQFNNAREHYNV